MLISTGQQVQGAAEIVRGSEDVFAMKPTLFQRLFTDDRPAFFLMALGALVAIAWLLRHSWWR